MTKIYSNILKNQTVRDNQVFTKSYVDQFHRENEQFRQDSGIDFYMESSDLVKQNHHKNFRDDNIANSDSITVNRNPS